MTNYVEINTVIHGSHTSRKIFPEKRKKEKAAMKIGRMKPMADPR
jgi:hypothetical protein